MRPGQSRLCQSKEHLALGTSKRNLENQGCCRGPAWSLGRDSGSSQTGQKVAPLGAAKKKKKKVLRLTDMMTPNLPRSVSGQRSYTPVLWHGSPLVCPGHAATFHLGRQEQASP